MALACLASCATTSDLARVESSVSDMRRSVDDAVALFAEGEMDAQDALQSVQAEADEAARVAAEVARDARERGWTAFDRIAGAILALGSLGVTGYAAVRTASRTINAERDSRREARGEPVGKVRRVKPAPKMGAE